MLHLFLIAFLFVTALPQEQTVEEVILEKAYQEIISQYDEEKYRFNISPRWIPGSILELNAENIKEVTANEAIKKYTNFKVVYSEHNVIRSKVIQLKINVEKLVPVAASRMLSGDVISENDLRMNWMSVDPGRENALPDINALVGKTLTRTVLAGQMITENMISSEFLINAGDAVSMIYNENGLHIILACESRQDGAVNQEIQIYCKETRTKYTAKVTGRGETAWVKTN